MNHRLERTFQSANEALFRANGQVRRTLRLGLYGGSAVGLVLVLVMQQSLINTAILCGLSGLLLWWCERWLRTRLPGKGDVMLRLWAGGLSSPYFNGPTKRFVWEDIASASLEGNAQARMLRLQLRPGPARPGWRARWLGIDPDRPTLPLQSLDAPEQERLFDAIHQHLQPTLPMGLHAALPGPRTRNELREANEWRARLQASKPIPWACAALVGVNALAWVVVGLRGGGWFDASPASLYAHGGNAASAVQAGQWWRLLSATFLHGGLMHLLFNMFGLWVAGALLERIFGSRQFLLIYFVSALAGSVASLFFSAQTNVSVGASGAVFGVAGALITAVLQHRQTLPKVFSSQILGGFSVYVAYSLLQGFTRPNIDNAAHVGGLLAGLMVAWVLPERFDTDAYRRWRGPRMALVALVAALVLPAAARLAPPAARDLAGQLAALEALPDVGRAYDEAMKAVQHDHEQVKAGRMSELEADARSRTVHAPRLRAVVQRMEATHEKLPPPAQKQLAPLLTLGRAMHEMLAMDSVVVNGKPVPVDARRAQELEATARRAADDIKRLSERKKR